jgi:hypothetical protein
MDAENKFRLIQARAYEIYCHRHPSSGSAEDDWRKAEAEIEGIEGEDGCSHNLGRAKLGDKSKWGQIATVEGEDFENPA